MREPTLEDILSADELENLGELDERSGWDSDEPVKPEFRRYQDPEISAFTTASYNMAHKFSFPSEHMHEKDIETVLSEFHETVARRPEENPVFVNSQFEKLLEGTPAPAYMRFQDGVYPVTVRGYDALQEVIESSEFQDFFQENSDVQRYREILDDELLRDSVIAPVLTTEEGLPQRLASGLVYSPETPLTADPDYSPDRQQV